MEAVIVLLLTILTLGLLVGVMVLVIMLRSISNRISKVEDQQTRLNERAIETDTITKNLAQSTSVIQQGLSQAQENLAAIQAHTKARQDLELRTAESIRRLEAIIAGTQTKGAAGENIVEVVFAQLPPEWQVRDFRVGNKNVEFGLRLPNNLILPIDSKWAATELLEKFLAAEDTNEQQRLKTEIERAVLAKAKEVRKYLDPNLTADFGIAAVPDAVFDLCGSVQVQALRINIVLISYSLFIPYLLLVYQMMLKSSQTIDLQRLNAYLDTAQANVSEIQEELEGRFSRAIAMLNNSRDDMRVQLSKIASGLTSLRISSTAETPQIDEVPEKVEIRNG